MAKMDITDAYYSILMSPEHQKFLKFSLQGKLYKITCLSNRWPSGPIKFTKLLTPPPLHALKLDYVKIAAYIDDLITLSHSFDIQFKNAWTCIELLGELDFVAHREKSVFAPSQETEYLRFIINSVNMTLRLTTEKKRKIFDHWQEVLLKETVSSRFVSKLLGKFTSRF